MMMKEAYVNFEMAKFLKEKGFNVPCFAHWYIGGEAHEKFSDYPFNWNEVKSDLDWLSRPTHQMTRAWLRETYGIDIIIEITHPSVKHRKYYCMIWDGNNKSHILDLFNSYEEAVEAALGYCFEYLI